MSQDFPARLIMLFCFLVWMGCFVPETLVFIWRRYITDLLWTEESKEPTDTPTLSDPMRQVVTVSRNQFEALLALQSRVGRYAPELLFEEEESE